MRIYNYEFFIPPFAESEAYLTYSEYMQLNVGYYYYGMVRDAFGMPWKQAVFLRGIAKSTGSEWLGAILEGRSDRILDAALEPCYVSHTMVIRYREKTLASHTITAI